MVRASSLILLCFLVALPGGLPGLLSGPTDQGGPGPGAVHAQARAEGLPAEKRALFLETLRVRAFVEAIAADGIASGPEIETQLFPGRGGAGWRIELERIFDADRLYAAMADEVSRRLSEEHADVLISFFSSPLGMRVVEGEVSARVAMLDPETDTAMREIARDLREEGGARIAQITALIDAYDLVTNNVVGSLNSNYAFYRGLVAGGALPNSMTEDQIVNEVWSQQREIRRESEDWLYAYLLSAYSDLSDAELETYIAFADTDAAQAFNSALFDGFGAVYLSINRALGRAAADRILAQDI